MRFNYEQIRTMNRAIATWGEKQQVTKAIEEFAELQQVLCKWLNLDVQVRNGSLDAKTLKDKIHEELADVTIMITQLHSIFGTENLDKKIAAKLYRLETYLPLE